MAVEEPQAPTPIVPVTFIERVRVTPGTYAGLVWSDETAMKLKRLLMANPRASTANIAGAFKVSQSTMRSFLDAIPEAAEIIELSRAMGDNAIAEKNFQMALKGDARALEREMKKRGMIGNDLLPISPAERSRDYSKLSVEELEALEKIDKKTRTGR